MIKPTSEIWLRDVRGRHFPLRSFIPKGATSQMTIVHGFAQHTACYLPWIKELNQHKIAVHIFDQVGHGEAEGIRGYVYNFQDFINNLEQVTESTSTKLKSKPHFLFGHSMGALVAAHYMKQKKTGYKGLILASPLMGFDWPLSFYGNLIAKYFLKQDPSLPFPKPPGHNALSRDPESLKAYRRDPLRLQVITPNLYLQFGQWSKDMVENAGYLTCPTLTFLSDSDQVVSPRKVTQFFTRLGSEDKKLIVFSRSMHEILEEKEKSQLTRIALQWMKERI